MNNKKAAKILVADDDLEILELLKFTFESDNYDVVTASDGEEALRKVKETMPDIVILDINMPKLLGYEVCEKMREDKTTKSIPVIILTSLTKTKDKITGIKLGADEYLNKPFEAFELLARVEGLLKRKKDSLPTNKITGLFTGVCIEDEIASRIEKSEYFALMVVDVDNFRSFNEYFGFNTGDSAIKMLGEVIEKAVSRKGKGAEFIGHFGGEDFIILTAPDVIGALSEDIIKIFDASVLGFYDEKSKNDGYVTYEDVRGRESKLSILTMSIGIAVSEPGRYKHHSEILQKAKDMAKLAKSHKKSSFVLG